MSNEIQRKKERLFMKLSQYGYDFSPEMLAKYPANNRDESRLMVINRAKGTIEHRIFKDIIEYFDEKDLFIFNDTKVFPAQQWCPSAAKTLPPSLNKHVYNGETLSANFPDPLLLNYNPFSEYEITLNYATE